MCVQLPFELSFFDWRFEYYFSKTKMLLSLIGLTASCRPVFAFCSKCCIVQDVCCEVSGGRLIATVPMSAMIRNSPTKKTTLKVTMSMMTTMTPVLHRDFKNDWSSFSFSTIQVAYIHGVI